MDTNFNKTILFDNIAYLIKKRGMKIGELESEAGVSPGYISRTSKDGSTKPGIDFIMNVATALNVSIDMLLRVDMANITPTEQYLISFLEKLNSDTANDKLEWDCETAVYLNHQLAACGNEETAHPLFSLETFLEEGEIEYPEEVTRVVFTSKSYGVHTYIHGDCFNLRMKNGVYLYLMNISKSNYRNNDPSAFAKEIWMYPTKGLTKQFLCRTGVTSSISSLIEELYETVSENTKHPKVSKDIRGVIDAFMRDDLEDDDELPFT